MTGAEARLARRALLAVVLLAVVMMSMPQSRARAQEADLLAPRLRPPPRHETIPPSPGRSYEWAPGEWRWDGYRFVWFRGRYIVRRPWTFRWIKGHAEGSGGLEKWVPGYYGQPKRGPG